MVNVESTGTLATFTPGTELPEGSVHFVEVSADSIAGVGMTQPHQFAFTTATPSGPHQRRCGRRQRFLRSRRRMTPHPSKSE